MRRSAAWIIGLPVWFMAGAMYFAYWETQAFLHPDRYDTLSYFIASVGAAWPFGIFLAGGVLLGVPLALGVHFYWSWKTNPLQGGG
jgi:hypothetical protein